MNYISWLAFAGLLLIANISDSPIWGNLAVFWGIGYLVCKYEALIDFIFSSNKSEKTVSKSTSFDRTEKKPSSIKNELNIWKPSHIKNCATCSHWAGTRKVNGMRSSVNFDQASRAECIGGGHDKILVPAVHICLKYQKWSLLK